MEIIEESALLYWNNRNQKNRNKRISEKKIENNLSFCKKKLKNLEHDVWIERCNFQQKHFWNLWQHSENFGQLEIFFPVERGNLSKSSKTVWVCTCVCVVVFNQQISIFSWIFIEQQSD